MPNLMVALPNIGGALCSTSIGPKSLYFATPLVFNSPADGFPWDDLRKIFSGYQGMAKVPNAVEILPKI